MPPFSRSMFQRLTWKEKYLFEKTVVSATAKKPVPAQKLAWLFTGTIKKVFFIS
jgi:hypothetical protein